MTKTESFARSCREKLSFGLMWDEDAGEEMLVTVTFRDWRTRWLRACGRR